MGEPILITNEQLQELSRQSLYAVMALFEADPHQYSDRPCVTCNAISAIAGKPFGCYNPDRKKRRY